MVDATAMDNEMLDLTIVVVGDPLKCIEIRLNYARHQRLLAPIRDMDLKLNRDRRGFREPVAFKLCHLPPRFVLKRLQLRREPCDSL